MFVSDKIETAHWKPPKVTLSLETNSFVQITLILLSLEIN